MKTDRSALRQSLHEITGYLTDYPYEDPTLHGKTMTPTQCKIAMLSLDLSQGAIAALFQKPPATVSRWLDGSEPVPLGIADWLRIRLTTRIKAMVGATGAPLLIEPQGSERPSRKALSMMGALISNLERERRFWINYTEGADAETLVRELRQGQSHQPNAVERDSQHAERITGIETGGIEAGPLSPDTERNTLLGTGTTPGDNQLTPPDRD